MKRSILLLLIIIIIGGSNLQPPVIAGNTVDARETYDYVFKPLTIIRDPLFSRPVFVHPGTPFNITLELDSEFIVTNVLLKNENHSYTSEYTTYNLENEQLIVEFGMACRYPVLLNPKTSP